VGRFDDFNVDRVKILIQLPINLPENRLIFMVHSLVAISDDSSVCFAGTFVGGSIST
jgi:hypothetical protein